MSRRLGLFGGSFNPVHNGHLYMAQAVKDALRLDGVLLMPAGAVPHKSCDAYAPAADRLAMCRMAAAAFSWMSVSDYEICKSGKNYTVETLRGLQSQYPDVSWTLLVGSDMLMCFDRWYRWQEILQMTSLCAVSRTEGDLPMLRKKAAELKESCPAAEIQVLSVSPFPVSSTEIRLRLQKNADCACVLPENVVKYIGEKQLYARGEENGQGGAE